MAELPSTDFTYSLMQQLIQESRCDQAIAMLTQRLEAQPQDRMAHLLLLLANVSQFGADPFSRQIEELRLFTELSSNERDIVRQIYLVCFQHSERDGQTIQKIVYQRLIRRLMLNQPLDLSITEAREIEQSEEICGASVAPAALSSTVTRDNEAEPQWFANPPRRLDRWDQYALIGAGAMIVIVLFSFYLLTGRKTSYAQNSMRLLSLVSGADDEIGISPDRTRPAVMLAPTFTAEPIRGMLLKQLDGLQESYTRWTDGDPNTRGSVSLKLRIEPSGKVIKVEEVVSRLSEHRFIDVVVREAKLWNLPHDGRTAAEVSVPLIFNFLATTAVQQIAQPRPLEPLSPGDEAVLPHTSFALEEAESSASDVPTVAKIEDRLEPHTRGPLEQGGDIEVALARKAGDDSPKPAPVKQAPAAESAIALAEAETARAAALKHEPRFAANAVEKIRLGTRVTVLRKERDWFKVKVQTSGNVGYLRKEYLAGFSPLR